MPRTDRWWTRSHRYLRTNRFTKYPYKGLVITLGALILLTGVAMLVLPGPGILTIALGLLLIGSEIPVVGNWTRTKYHRAKQQWAKVRAKRKGKHGVAETTLPEKAPRGS